MGTRTEQIEAHIEQAREALGSNLDELEQKVKAATDWRHHFRTKPGVLMGLAFGAGVVMSAVFGGRKIRRRMSYKSYAGPDPGAKAAFRDEVVARQGWDNVKGAIIAVATTRLLNYAGEAFLGFPRKGEHIDKTSGVGVNGTPA